ncbi:MAG TPA: hypothetical protein VFX85_12185 [Solirubrobacterales bacterium]|nr:hypothetical protein [Solirubrobacterales bacterium]
MATATKSINELDVVVLLEPVGRWPKGQEGTVVQEHGSIKLIEISDEQGQMLDLVGASESQLRLVWQFTP